jgi:hypothetical protein
MNRQPSLRSVSLSALALGCAALAVAAPAWGHPGHGQTEGLAHYLAEPVHVAFTALLLLAGLGVARLVRARRARRKLDLF